MSGRRIVSVAILPLAPLALDIDRVLAAQRLNQSKAAGTDAGERIRKLKAIERALMTRRDEIRRAMWEDFRKPAAEVDLSEIYPALGEVRHARRHLRRWMKPRHVPAPIALVGSWSTIVHEPKGVVLIISPWNFPFNLTLGPLISAVAAGNCVVLKPSELTPASSACMKRILGDLFDEDEVAVIEGDATVAQELLRRSFDHIFFTGSPAVGKIVMKAAAETLTSVTLELGGKSPVVVDKSADLDEAAKKIAWGKILNSGQTCIAPDYLLVDESIREPFTVKLLEAIRSMSGPSSRGLIVSERHGRRVRRLVEDAVAAGAQLLAGGSFTDDPRTIPPTVISGLPADCELMREEIFGPVLPMLTYSSLPEAMEIIRSREKPLVMYIFSRERRVIEELMAGTSAGGTVINHTLIHFFQVNLPFGGAGNSGIGRAHGFAGFEAFSNVRGVLDQKTKFSTITLLYPPYNAFKQKLIDLTLRFF